MQFDLIIEYWLYFVFSWRLCTTVLLNFWQNAQSVLVLF